MDSLSGPLSRERGNRRMRLEKVNDLNIDKRGNDVMLDSPLIPKLQRQGGESHGIIILRLFKFFLIVILKGSITHNLLKMMCCLLQWKIKSVYQV